MAGYLSEDEVFGKYVSDDEVFGAGDNSYVPEHEIFGTEPKETGYIPGVAKSLARGLAEIPVQAGKAMQYNANYLGSGTGPDDRDESKLNFVNKAGEAIAKGAEKARDFISEPEFGDDAVKRSVFQGVESLPVSLAYAAPSAIGATIGAATGLGTAGTTSVPGAIAGATIGQAPSAAIMYRAQAQQASEDLDKLQKQGYLREGVTNQEKLASAQQSGIAEFAGEGASNIAESVLFSRLPFLKVAAKTARGAVKPGLKEFAKMYAGVWGSEQIGEGSTAAGQTIAQNALLADDKQQSIGDAVLYQAGPTTVMSLLTAGAGGAVSRIRGENLAKKLESGNASEEDRLAAATKIGAIVKETNGNEAAKNFMEHAADAILNPATPNSIDLNDESLFAPLQQSTQAPPVEPPAPSGPISKALGAIQPQQPSFTENAQPITVQPQPTGDFAEDFGQQNSIERARATLPIPRGMEAVAGTQQKLPRFDPPQTVFDVGPSEEDSLMLDFADQAQSAQDSEDVKFRRAQFNRLRDNAQSLQSNTLGRPSTAEESAEILSRQQTPEMAEAERRAARREDVETAFSDPNALIPRNLVDSIAKMENDLKQGQANGVTVDGQGNESTVTGRFPSTNPNWFKQAEIKKFDAENGTSYAGSVSKASIAMALKKVRAGQSLTGKESRAWEYMRKAAEIEANKDPELIANREYSNLEKQGFEFEAPQTVPVGNLQKGDEVVVLGKNGVPDKLTHKGRDPETGNIVLQDGVRMQVDEFDQVEVIAKKKAEKAAGKVVAPSDPRRNNSKNNDPDDGSAGLDLVGAVGGENDTVRQTPNQNIEQARTIKTPAAPETSVDDTQESRGSATGRENGSLDNAPQRQENGERAQMVAPNQDLSQGGQTANTRSTQPPTAENKEGIKTEQENNTGNPSAELGRNDRAQAAGVVKEPRQMTRDEILREFVEHDTSFRIGGMSSETHSALAERQGKLRKEASTRFGIKSLEDETKDYRHVRDVRTIKKEIKSLQNRLDRINTNRKGAFNGGTRAQTTTANANAGRLAESIGALKEELVIAEKQATQPAPPQGGDPISPAPTGKTAEQNGARQYGARKQTKEGAALVKSAQEELRKVINNPDIVGKQRAERIANGRSLVGFLQANSAKKLETGYDKGDQIAFTGEDAPEGFRSFIYLEGSKAGQHGVKATEEAKSADAARTQKEWQDQQESFKRLKQNAESASSPVASQPRDTKPLVSQKSEDVSRKETTSPAKAEAIEAGESAPVKPKDGAVDDFGEKIGGARKDKVLSVNREISDDDIASLPLSKIWPKEEIDNTEDIFVAAFSTAARAEIPSKPRQGYKLTRWVEAVKLFRKLNGILVGKNQEGGGARKSIIEKINKEYPSLKKFLNKVFVLEGTPREHWQRIGEVDVHPDAYRYGDNDEKIPSPSAYAYIDGKFQRFDGAKTIDEAIPAINEYLAGREAAVKSPLKFEIRGQPGSYSINKKGDAEYRKLKTFDTVEAARTFLKDNRDELVTAWEETKGRDNVKKTDVRGEENRPRVGKDRRNGKDATTEMFSDTFGFRGGVFGRWVSQGKGNKDRQGMLNQAFDAFSDLADILGVPPKALSLNGTLGLSFGASGHGWASAHYSPSHIAINLTKTRGAGALAHEFFHALDNYFSHQRGGEVAFTGDQQRYREDNYVTYKPEPLMVNKKYHGSGFSRARLAELRAANPSSGYLNNEEDWIVDPNHREGVRPEVETAFADLVAALNASPMAKRASKIDKTSDGYWSRVIERAARAFENYVIEKMTKGGYHNDYLANVVEVTKFQRDRGRYPYLLPEEIKPIEEAFDNLFSTIKTKETDKGVALYSRSTDPPSQQSSISDLTTKQRAILSKLRRAGKVEVVSNDEAMAVLERESGAEVRESAGGRIEGLVLKSGKAYIVPENIAKNDLWAKVRHEVGIHVGKALQSTNGFQRLLASIESRKNEQSATGKAIRAAMAKVPKDTNPANVQEEVLAYLVANNKEISIVRRVIAMVKNAMVKLGISPNIFTADDLTALAEIAVRREARTATTQSTDSGPLFSKGNASISTILADAKTSTNETTKQLAELLEGFIPGSKLDIPVSIDPSAKSAKYEPGKNLVTIRDRAAFETSLHEIVHAVTVNEMEANPDINRRVTRLMNTVKRKAVAQGLLSQKTIDEIEIAGGSKAFKNRFPAGSLSGVENIAYAFLNEKEFLAQAFSSPQFQGLLKNTKLTDQGKMKLAFDAFVEMVMKALGIKNVNGNAFGEAVKLVAELAGKENVNEFAQPVSESLGSATDKIKNLAAFQEWFGGSKAVDGDGHPLVVYHGTSSDFKAFDKEKIGANYRDDRRGFFFTDDPMRAGWAASDAKGNIGGNEAIIPAHISIKKPVVIDGRQDVGSDAWGFFDANKSSILRKVRSGRHDGLIVKGALGDTLYMVIEPTQIKSIFNTKWDPANPDIMESYEALSIGKTASDIADTYRDLMADDSYVRKLPTDSTLMSKIFSSPEYTFKKAAAAWRAIQVQYNRMDEKIKLENDIFGTVVKDDGTKTGFIQTMQEAKKKFKAAYERANKYLLEADRTGKTFTLKKQNNFKVTDPDGEIVGFAETKTGAYRMAEIDHGKKYKGTDTLKSDYKTDEGEFWSVVDKDGKEVALHENDRDAAKDMMDREGDMLRGKGFDEKTVELVREYREMTNRAFNMMIADLRKIIAEAKEKGLDEPTVSVVDETKRWVVLENGKKIATFGTKEDAQQAAGGKHTIREQADDEIRKDMKLSEVIATMSDLRGSYFARQRERGSIVLRAEKDGEKIMKKFDFHMVGDKFVDSETGVEYNRAPLDWMKKSFNFAMTAIPGTLSREMRILKSKGYTITSVGKENSMPESVFDTAKLVSSLSAMLSEAKNKADKKGVDKTLIEQAHKILMGELSNIIKERGYMSSRLKRTRDYVKGFEEDMLLSGTQYGRGLSAGIAKKEAARQFIAVATGTDIDFDTWKSEHLEEDQEGNYDEYLSFVEKRKLDPLKQPGLYADVMSWVKEMLRNEEQVDRVMGTLQGIAVIKFLGFRVSSAVVNATNMLQGVPATISSHTGGTIHGALAEVGRAIATYGKFRTGKDISASDRAVLLEIVNNGWDEAQFNKDSVSVLQSKLGRGWSQFSEYAMKVFGAVEKTNRAVTILAAYNQFRKNTELTHDEAMQKAKHASDRAHGVYGKATRQAWTRGAWNPLRLFTTFTKFSQSYAMNMVEMGLKGDHKAAAYMLLSPAVLAGAGATAASPVIVALASALGVGGDDPEEEFYKWAEETFGTDRFARHGLAGLAGVNLKGSIQMNNPMPTKISEIFGAPGAIFTDTAKGLDSIRKGEYEKGAEALLPTAIGTMVKSVREANEGITTGSYSPVFYGNEPIKSDGLEATIRFIGFNPSRISGIREKQWSEKKVAQKFQERRDEINSMIKKSAIYGKGDISEVYKEIQRYNELVIGSGRSDISLINPAKQFRMVLRRAQSPSKMERRRFSDNPPS